MTSADLISRIKARQTQETSLEMGPSTVPVPRVEAASGWQPEASLSRVNSIHGELPLGNVSREQGALSKTASKGLVGMESGVGAAAGRGLPWDGTPRDPSGCVLSGT